MDSWPRDLISFKKKVSNIAEPFEKTPNKKKLFFDMESIQNQALIQLTSKGILSIESLKKGIVILEKNLLPSELLENIISDDFNNGEAFKTIVNGVGNFPWLGETGLKKRSGLMEYKYDEQ